MPFKDLLLDCRMITDIRALKKIDEILNSEGTILGLHSLNKKLYLSSFLKDGSGTVYYATTKDNLIQYLNGNITLKELYNSSDDFMVVRISGKEMASHLKKDFADVLQCGDQYFSELQDSMRNLKIIDKIKDI